jgi:cell division protein FtsB
MADATQEDTEFKDRVTAFMEGEEFPEAMKPVIGEMLELVKKTSEALFGYQLHLKDLEIARLSALDAETASLRAQVTELTGELERLRAIAGALNAEVADGTGQ